MPYPLLCLVGPTAVGKTELSLDLAEALNAEIVSADSMQVYRTMDIGTGKIPVQEQRGIAHHMIDVADPTYAYTVHEYAEQARPILAEIIARGRLPLIVGGTGLYVRAVIDHFDFAGTDRNPELREQLNQEAQRVGSPVLHERLQQLDGEAASRIHPNDARRTIRALEIVMTTGQPRSANFQGTESPYRPILIGVTSERQALYRRIEQRIDHMVEKGLVSEVSALVERGCNESHTAMQAIGYKEILQHLRGHCTLEVAIEAIKQVSRRYAKRQWSWFRADRRIVWYERSEDGMMMDVVMPYILTELEQG